MDIRTTQVLEALGPVGAELVLNLLQRPRSEKELVLVTGVPQPTVHRKLQRLAEVGIVSQGLKDQGRGQPWSVAAPDAARRLLNAVFDYADALEAFDQRERGSDRQRLGEELSTRMRPVDAVGR